MSGAEDLLHPCLLLRLVASFQLPQSPFKKFSFRLVIVFLDSLCSSLFSICALRFSLSLRMPFFWACTKIFRLFAPFSICVLRFSLFLRLPFFRGCAKIFPVLPHVLSEKLRPLLPLSPPSFLLFFAVQPALPTSCPVLVLSLASLCFSFVLKWFCKR